MEWETKGVSVEPEEVLEIIKNDLKPPYGIVVFGADSGLKAKVYEYFRRNTGGPLAFDRCGIEGHTKQVQARLEDGKPVLVCMHGSDAIHHGARVDLVNRLRRLGATSVVGVYVKATRQDGINYKALDMDLDYPTYYRQVDKLAQDPPSNKRYDLFVVVESQ